MSFEQFKKKNSSLITIYLMLIILFVATSLISPVFYSYENISNILRQSASLGIISIGQTFIVLLAGADLSVGAVVSLVTVLCATLMKDTFLTIFLSILLCLAVGTGIGFLNGLLVSKGKLPGLIATMSMMVIIQGVSLLIMASPGGYIPRSFENFITTNLCFIPLPAIIFILLIVIAIIVLRKTILGNHIYATGGSEESAKLAGINVDRVKIFSFMICSFMAAISGLLLAGRIRSGDPLIGTSFNLDSITAVVLGGTSFVGGCGGVEGTIAGVLIISMLSNILNLLNVSSFYQYILKGLILLVAVILYSLRRKR